MIAPRLRRAPTPLDPAEVARLVAMRDQGITWREIGRVFAKQDGACKRIYDRARTPTRAQATP